MKMQRKKTGIYILLLMLLLCSLGVTAFAADTSIDFTRKGSLTILLKGTDGDYLEGARLRLYQVAEIDADQATLSYLLTEDFANSGISLQDLRADTLAEQLYTYAKKKNLSCRTENSNRQGTAEFDNLALGLYLVAQVGNVSGYYQISPFLVEVPMTNAKGSAWEYCVSAKPKVEPEPTTPADSGSTKVEKKQDSGDKTETLIQTGQLNWPIPILAGGGLTLFMLGWIVTARKKNKKDAE